MSRTIACLKTVCQNSASRTPRFFQVSTINGVKLQQLRHLNSKGSSQNELGQAHEVSPPPLALQDLKSKNLAYLRPILATRSTPQGSNLSPITGVLLQQLRHSHFKGFPQDEKGHTYTHPEVSPTPPGPKTVDDFKNPSKNGNWWSYGYDYHDPERDKLLMHEDFFFFVSVFIILTSWVFHYCPDYKYNEWARREAYLQLCKREKLGLDPIDINVVDPDRVVLPEEEEFEDIIEIRL